MTAAGRACDARACLRTDFSFALALVQGSGAKMNHPPFFLTPSLGGRRQIPCHQIPGPKLTKLVAKDIQLFGHPGASDTALNPRVK